MVIFEIPRQFQFFTVGKLGGKTAPPYMRVGRFLLHSTPTFMGHAVTTTYSKHPTSTMMSIHEIQQARILMESSALVMCSATLYIFARIYVCISMHVHEAVTNLDSRQIILSPILPARVPTNQCLPAALDSMRCRTRRI